MAFQIKLRASSNAFRPFDGLRAGNSMRGNVTHIKKPGNLKEGRAHLKHQYLIKRVP